jgi:hypothetical protein
MRAQTDANGIRTQRPWFYGAAVFLMLLGVIAAFFQKLAEGTVTADAAKGFVSGARIGELIVVAERWTVLSYAVIFLAIVSWCTAVWRRESQRSMWVPVAILFCFYVLLELLAF